MDWDKKGIAASCTSTWIELLLASVTPYAHGVRINKETGEILFIEFSDRLDIFCVMLERLFREGQHEQR